MCVECWSGPIDRRAGEDRVVGVVGLFWEWYLVESRVGHLSLCVSVCVTHVTVRDVWRGDGQEGLEDVI